MRAILSFAILTCLAAGHAVRETYVLHEKRDGTLPSSLTKRNKLDGSTTLPMRIGLTQNNLHKAHDWLNDVSHPTSLNYGHHWTQQEVIEAFKPSDESFNSVMNWLTSSGISAKRITHSDNKQWLAFDATVVEAESLLHADYHEYEHRSGTSMIGCDEYHVPKRVSKHVDYITPGVKRSQMRKRGFGVGGNGKPFGWKKPFQHPSPPMSYNHSQLDTCDVAVTPACIQALYNFKPLSPTAKVSSKNSMGIYEEGDYYSQLDLNLFYSNFTKYIPNGTHPILDSIDGGNAPVAAVDAGVESSLDFQLAIPIVYPQTTTLYQTDDLYYAQGYSKTATGIFNTFLDAIDGSYCTYSAYGETGNDPILDPTYPDPNGYSGKLMCGVYKPTNIISISYGEQESDLPAYYQKRQCNEFLKLGLQGVSIFVASGDTGVGGYQGEETPNGCLGANDNVFSPTQPNSCPYLTNVGATKIFPGKTPYDRESAVDDPAGHPYSSDYYSGGGFSNIFTVPDYQAAAVQEYFLRAKPPYPYYFDGKYQNATNGGIYNRNGRGIPDVAANGDNIATYVGGSYALHGGTSASSPIFAAIVNRIVEERIKVGKGPVGFINPVLYANPGVLNDIVNGSNPGCGTDGFKCAKGWDPVTGLGTPNYPKMLELFLSLP